MTRSDFKNTASALIHKTFDAAIDEGLNCCASDLSEDSHGDIVGDRRYENNGWTNLPEFDDKNPIILVNHNKNDPIGTALNTRVEGDKLKFKLKLAPAGTSIKADECRALVRAKILRGISVGFISLQSVPRANGGTHHQKMRLVEISLVSIPANSSAFLEAKRLGVSTQTIRKIFKMNNDTPKAATKRYTREEKAAIMRRAKQTLAKSKIQTTAAHYQVAPAGVAGSQGKS